MRMRQILLPLLFCFVINRLPAQQKVILEEIRYGSRGYLTMSYWKIEEVRKTFASQLNKILLKHLHLPLADTNSLNLHNQTEDLKGLKKVPDAHYTDTTNIHMFIDILENSPGIFFLGNMATQEDSTLVLRAKSVFQVRVILEKGEKNVVLNAPLDMVISSGNTAGIGIESGLITMTPKGFTDMLKAALDIILNPENEILQVELKVTPAFGADNYILPKTQKQPRIYVTTNKNISRYTYNDTQEMIRFGEGVYEEITLRGKNAEKYSEALTKEIRKSTNYSGSTFLFLRQEARDVLGDKNYQVQLLTQLDPDKPVNDKELVFTNFLFGDFHYLFQEKDTIATFNIERNVPDGSNKIYVSQVSNGSDPVALYTLPGKEITRDLTYDYVVNGKIGKQDFSIKCSGFRNSVKEFYLNSKLVCIAQGKFSPERFVVFDASLSPGLLKQLFMIGFNRFFE
jgi:hypothetical protein